MQVLAAIFAAASKASCAGEAEITGCDVEKEVLSQLLSAVDWLGDFGESLRTCAEKARTGCCSSVATREK